MKDITKYQGVIPAFYACYDAEGNISTEGVKALTRHLIAKGVKGVYVGGSSGECISSKFIHSSFLLSLYLDKWLYLIKKLTLFIDFLAASHNAEIILIHCTSYKWSKLSYSFYITVKNLTSFFLE